MRKKNNFLVLSNKKCIVCGTRLKQNLIDVKPEANMCYRHYQMIVRKSATYPMDKKGEIYLKQNSHGVQSTSRK